MSVKDFLRSLFSKQDRKPVVHVYGYETSQGKSRPLDYSDYLSAFNGWVFAAVNVISNSLAKVRWHITKEAKNGELVEVERHPVLKLIGKPNPLMTRWELFKLTDIHLELTGNAYWYLAMNSFGIPAEIWIIPPDRMKVVPNEEGLIKGYLYDYMGEKIAFEPKEIIHFKFPHPTNRYYGMGVLQAVAYEHDTDLYMKKYQLSLFKNRAMPDVVIRTEQPLTQEEARRLRAEWNAAYRGVDRAGKIAVVSKALDVQPLGLTPKELEYLEGRRFSRDTILHIWGVPPSKLGIVEDVNRANAEANDYTFQNEVILPRLELMREVLQWDLLNQFWKKENLKIEFENPVPKDKQFRLKQHEAYIKNGVLTINEVRAELGLEPVDWGEVPLMPLNLYPISAPKPEPEKTIIVSETKQVKSMFKDEAKREQIWKLFVAQTTPLEKLFASRIKKLFHKQEKEVLDNLFKYKSFLNVQRKDYDDLVDFIIFDVQEWNRILQEELGDLHREAYASGIDRAIALMGVEISFDVDNPAAVEFLRNKTMRFAEQVNQTTINDLKQQLIAGFQNGESIDEIAERVRDVFNFATESRSRRIARTEIIGATNAGIEDTFKESQVVEYKEWLTARDELVRDAHAAADGQAVKLNEVFDVGGEALKFPGDPDGSPENIVNCRCTLLPVLKEGGNE